MGDQHCKFIPYRCISYTFELEHWLSILHAYTMGIYIHIYIKMINDKKDIAQPTANVNSTDGEQVQQKTTAMKKRKVEEVNLNTKNDVSNSSEADPAKKRKKKKKRKDLKIQKPADDVEYQWKVADTFDAFKQRVSKQSKRFACIVFPDKILKLSKKKEDMEQKKYLYTFHPPKAYSLPFSEAMQKGEENLDSRDRIPCNIEILHVMEMLKKEVMELIDMLSTMKIWVRLSRPKFEDGNNFGVNVQNDVLTSIATGAMSARNMLSQFHQYYVRRASFMRRCEKYPSIEDWRESVVISDEKQYDEAINVIGDLQQLYLTLYDRLMKNWKMVTMPKGRERSQSNIYF